MQQGDFSSAPYYHQYHQPHLQNLSPNPNDLQPNSLNPTCASAPPFSANCSAPDYSGFSSGYPPYSQNPEPVPDIPPSAPSYAQNPSFQSFAPFSESSTFPSFPHTQEPQASLTPPIQQPAYYPPYDQHQTPSNYTPSPSIPPNPNPNLSSSFPAPYSYGQIGSSVPPPPPVYGNLYESSVKFDHGGGYLDDNSGRYGGAGVYGRNHSDLGTDFYENRTEPRYDRDGLRDDGLGNGVYAYNGGKVEPYSARGTASKSSMLLAFDDYGRSINFSSGKEQAVSTKIVRAVPKAETQQDVKNGVLKFRVKLLPEGGSLGTTDVLCQIGLDGIHMLDPSSSRTLRIYPLETVTRWEVIDSSIFTFWSKSSVDIEPRRIRLQSNSYTTNTILDNVTAATVQLKEMGGQSKPSEPVKFAEQYTEKKKGFADWMNLIKPGNEEKDHWVPDEAVSKCTACRTDFGAFVRRHHCRNCGDIFCDKCTHGRIALTADEQAQPVRVCDQCMAEVTQRLSSAREAASKPVGLHSHEDLARKLQEEMDKNRRVSSGSKSDGSGKRMREVACPTCTVHLQVQVPISGSETIECGVCQHPFLVSAH